MKNTFVSRIAVFGMSAVAMSLTIGNTASADRGGWADPPGGWTFVEDWQEIPEFENDDKWNHNNGSDSWSGGANDAIIAEFEVTVRPGEPVGDLVGFTLWLEKAKPKTV